SVPSSCATRQGLAIGSLIANFRAEDDMDPAGAIICSWRPDDDVVAAVVIQVGQDDRCSELIAGHALAETGSLLGQDVARSCGKPQIDLAGIAITPRHTNDQIGLAIAVH